MPGTVLMLSGTPVVMAMPVRRTVTPAEPLAEVVSTGVVESVSEKSRIENLIFLNQ